MLTRIMKPTSSGVEAAAGLLRKGEVVAIPTETVYGLAASALLPEAVAKIFAAKGRPQDNPLIVHIGSPEDLELYAAEVPEAAPMLAKAFWPGPLTMVLRKKPVIPDVVTAGMETVGLRLPAHPAALAVIRKAGVPLAAPSANTSGRPSTTTASHVAEDLAGKIPLILNGGPCGVGLESTVVSLTGDRPRLLRPGGISLPELEAVLGPVDCDPAVFRSLGEGERPSAPGQKYRHYAPRARVVPVKGADGTAISRIQAECEAAAGQGLRPAVLCFDGEQGHFPGAVCLSYGVAAQPQSLAAKLFDSMRRFDALPADVIFVRLPPSGGMADSVINRIMKAAEHQAIDAGE